MTTYPFPIRSVLLLSAALAVLLAGLLGVPRPAYAANCDDNQLVVGGTYTLADGDVLDRNLVVMGGDADIEAGARIDCSLIIFGGDVTIAGTVGEDVVMFGGRADLAETAVVEGDLATVGGDVNRAEGAEVKGNQSQGFGSFNPGRPFTPPNPYGDYPLLGMAFDFFRRLVETIVSAVGMALLALLVVVFWPDQTSRVSAAILNAPAAAGGLGLLTGIAGPVLIGLLAITLCLIPVAFAGLVVFVAALAFGWIALGQIVGARLAAALRLHSLSPAASAAIGTGLLSLTTGIIGWIWCVGWVPGVLLGLVGLGAVVLTAFGTRPYLREGPATPMPPAAPPPPAEPAITL